MSDIVYHQAKVTAVASDAVDVLLEKGSACATCYNRGACSSLDNKNVVYHIETKNAQNFYVGEMVTIGISVNSGLKAVVLAYIIPLILLLVVCFLLQIWIKSELWQILITLGVIVVYYVLLGTQKHRLNQKFTFTIDKLQ